MIEPIAGVPSTAAIVVVAADEQDLQGLVARLERRYGTEYDVMGLRSGADGLALLSNLRDGGGMAPGMAPSLERASPMSVTPTDW